MALRRASIVGIIGAPLTGKGLYAHEWIAAGSPRARVVWSPVEASDDYAGLLRVKACERISAMARALMEGARAVVFVPSLERDVMLRQFDLFCRVAWNVRGARVLVEELSRVTSPSWAPPSWRNLSTSGSHVGLELAATAQRAAQVDKDFLGGCTEVRCYRQNRRDDARAVENETGIPWAEVVALPDRHYRHLYRPARIVAGVQPLPKKNRAKARPAE